MKREIIKQNVGVDVSMDDFKANFQQLFADQSNRVKSSRKFDNNLSGFKLFVKWVEQKREATVPVRVTMEATGVYYEQLSHYLNEQSDFYLSVELPNKTKAYFKSLNLKSKTDKIDAKALGKMGLERDLKEWKPFSSEIRVFKQLTRDRVRLLEHKTQLTNQLHALSYSYQPNKDVLNGLKKLINILKSQVKEVEKQILKELKKNKELKKTIEGICQMKGLGLITVIAIIAETNGFQLFTSRAQLISWAGYDVVSNESGSSINGKTRISKKGNRYIRRALHFPAIVAKQNDERMGQLYERVFEKSYIKMKGLVAVQRKLLLLVYALFKKNEAYDKDYLQKMEAEKKVNEKNTAVLM